MFEKRWCLSLPVSVAHILVIFTSLMGCARREPRVVLSPLNQTVTILPTVVNGAGPAQLPLSELLAARALHVTVMWEGALLNDPDTELRFYKGLDSVNPDLKIRWGDWVTWFRTSGCSNDQIATLDGPGVGVALACDGRVRIEQFVKIEAENKKGKIRSATSWATWRLTDDVVAASIHLL